MVKATSRGNQRPVNIISPSKVVTCSIRDAEQSYLSSDVPLQPLGTREVGVGLPTAVTTLSVSQFKRVHGKYMLQNRVKFKIVYGPHHANQNRKS